MTASTPYTVENWRDPEILFGEEYQPFDLVRDLNGYTASDYDFVENDYAYFNTEARGESLDDVKQEDIKENLFVAAGICNLNTVSSDEFQSKECLNSHVPKVEAPQEIADGNIRMFKVRHISENGPIIEVSEKRYTRMMKQRVKREAFLRRFPEYALPYKQRSKDIKYKKRSEMAKERKRNALGKFSTFARAKDIDFELDLNEVTKEKRTKWKRHN
jgi:hypothetical protein